MRFLFIISLFLIYSCSPANYSISSNTGEKVLLDARTTLKLINKSKEAVKFYIVSIEDPNEEVTVEVRAKGFVNVDNFECGRYDVYVKDQMLKNNFIRPKFKNKFTYEVKR